MNSFDVVVQFLQQAARDPDVVGDQADPLPQPHWTVDRGARSAEAAEAGKSVRRWSS